MQRDNSLCLIDYCLLLSLAIDCYALLKRPPVVVGGIINNYRLFGFLAYKKLLFRAVYVSCNVVYCICACRINNNISWRCYFYVLRAMLCTSVSCGLPFYAELISVLCCGLMQYFTSISRLLLLTWLLTFVHVLILSSYI
jgi:hypothetical protein